MVFFKNNFFKQVLVGTSFSVLLTSQAFALSIEERVERLERMASNPVILKLKQQIQDQQREVQSIQNRLDLLVHESKQPSDSDQGSTQAEFKSDEIELIRQVQAQHQLRLQKIETALSLLLPGFRPEPTSGEPFRSENRESAVNPALNRVPPVSVSTPPVIADAQGDETSSALVPKQQPPMRGEKPQASESLSPNGPITTRAATQAETKAYQAAFALMRKSKYRQSVEAFMGFATQYPNSDLAPNAWYWAGEGLYIIGDEPAAKTAFEKVVATYPKSGKLHDAKLRLADAYVNLNQNDQAKSLYQEIIQQAPQSRAAENAKKRLENL